MTEERKQVVNDIPFPVNAKQMRSFLGAALFFQSFVPNYATLAAPLNDMIKNDFDWSPKSWKVDYQRHFMDMKKACVDSFQLACPDFDKRWVLRTDASQVGK